MKSNTTFEQLADMIFHITRLMKHKMSFTSELASLSIQQIQTLIFISHHEKVTMSDIAEYFHIELPSATSLLNKLYDQKLVRRLEDEKDRRLVLITLTNKGKDLEKIANRKRREKLRKVLSYLPEKEQSDLLNILKTLYTKLESEK